MYVKVSGSQYSFKSFLKSGNYYIVFSTEAQNKILQILFQQLFNLLHLFNINGCYTYA